MIQLGVHGCCDCALKVILPCASAARAHLDVGTSHARGVCLQDDLVVELMDVHLQQVHSMKVVTAGRGTEECLGGCGQLLAVASLRSYKRRL